MKFLIFSSLPSNSGCFLRATYLGDALRRLGHDVKVVKPPSGWPLMLDMLYTLFKYFFIALFTRFDFGFAIKPYPNTVIPLLFKRMITGQKRCRVGVDIDDLDYGYRKGLMPVISRAMQIPFPRHFDIVTCHNDNLAAYIPGTFKVPKERIYRLEQGVDLTVFKTGSIDKEFKARFVTKHGLTPGKILVYTAHLNIASDLDAILDAFWHVEDRDPMVRLVVAGGGPMFGYFRNLAATKGLAKSVIFTGDLASADVRKFVAMADVCLVYYKDKEVNYYRTSMKLREYLAMSKRVAANDVGDLKAFKNLVFQSGSRPEEYARTITTALAAEGDMRHIKAATMVRKNFNWDDIASQFAERVSKLFL